MKRYLPLILALCLLTGCMVTRAPEPTVGADVPIGPTATPAPEPTATPAPSPEPDPGPTPVPELSGEALALLELSDTDRVLDKAAGDLNGDGLEDWAVVIEKISEAEGPGEHFTDAPRTLAILLNDGAGSYTQGQTNDHFIRRDTQGGVYGDPYEGIFIREGKLHYGDYGGSAWRWGNDYTFSWQGDGLVLTRMEAMSRYGGRGIVESYDLLEGEYTQRAFSEGEDWDCGTGLLWEQDISMPPPRLEEMPNAWDGEPWREELPPLPGLGFYGYEERGPLEKSPEELLDQVREEHFPHMRRVDLPWTAETRANYSAAVGRPIPGYYYADETGRLSWYEGSSVMYESLDGKTMDFY